MNKVFIVVALSLFLYGCTKNPSADEHPTKEEWLDVYLTHKIKQNLDVWEERIAVQVEIISELKVVNICLVCAVGQDEISQTTKNMCANDVENIVKLILEKYEQIRSLAVAAKQYPSAVSAVTGKARLHGFDKDNNTKDPVQIFIVPPPVLDKPKQVDKTGGLFSVSALFAMLC